MRVGFNPVWLMSLCTCAELLSHVWPFATLWTMTCHDLCPWGSPGMNIGLFQWRRVRLLSSRASSWHKDENPHLLDFPPWQVGSLTGPSGKPRRVYKPKKFRDRQLERENGVWRWRCITQERGLDQILPSGPQRKPTMLTSWSQTSSLWTMKQLHFGLFKATWHVHPWLTRQCMAKTTTML